MKKIIISSLVLVTCSLLINSCGNGSSSASFSLPQIQLKNVNGTLLPALNHPIVAYYNGYWLILGGQTQGIHSFNYNTSNQTIYVYQPSTNSIWYTGISATDLIAPVESQLTSLAQASVQDGNTLYIVGGYYNNPSDNSYTTLNTVSSYNVSEIINAVINGSAALNQYVNVNTTQMINVTGGDLEKIGDDFYLAFGQSCQGNYCSISQTYTNAIYKFTMESSLANINILESVSNADDSNTGFRRRDYTLIPFKESNIDTILALGGPFTQNQNSPTVWTNVISFNKDLQYTNSFLNQQANQYRNASLPMYSASSSNSYAVSLSGISGSYWSESGVLTYDLVNVPFGNIIELINYNASNKTVNDYANTQPMCSGLTLANCLYSGADAVFVRESDTYFDYRGILQLDKLNGTTLVGYLYGGIVSTQLNPFNDGVTNNTLASNQVFAVYITPNSSSQNWINITNKNNGTAYVKKSTY